jgi:hypothetical protein
MSNNNVLKVFLVAFGATSYGMLATFVKWPMKEGYTTRNYHLTICLGIIGILLINLFQKQKQKHSVTSVKAKYISTNAGRHIIRMTSFLLFSRKIYSCFHWVVLMQSVWMGLLMLQFGKELLLLKNW